MNGTGLVFVALGLIVLWLGVTGRFEQTWSALVGAASDAV